MEAKTSKELIKQILLKKEKMLDYILQQDHPEYEIDDKKSEVVFKNLSSVYLESFLTKEGMLKSDSRNWSNTFNILSGRLQLPSKDKLEKFGIQDIPEPKEILSFMDVLAEKLTESKRNN